MSRIRYQLLAAAILAFGLHGMVLFWQLPQKKITLPAPLPLKKIVVSLGPKPVIKKTVIKKSEPEPKPRITSSPPEPQPVVEPVIKPTVKPVLKPVAKPQPVEKQKKISPPVLEEPPPEAKLITAEKSKTAVSSPVIRPATPIYRLNPPPKYPRLAQRRGLEGVVLLEVWVDIQGRVKELRISSSSGHSILDKAALKAVRNWRFSTGSIRGKPEEMWVKVPVRFQLQPR